MSDMSVQSTLSPTATDDNELGLCTCIAEVVCMCKERLCELADAFPLKE